MNLIRSAHQKTSFCCIGQFPYRPLALPAFVKQSEVFSKPLDAVVCVSFI